MLKIEPSQTSGVYSLILEGTITEDAELKGDVPAGAQRLDVFCKGITRVNSMGITKWILFFREIRKKGIAVRYFEMPVAVVNLCNFVSGMVEPGEIQSFYLPYFCDSCNHEMSILRTSESFRELRSLPPAKSVELPALPCAACQKPAQFDGVPANYLEFLKA
jgi:ABC-type transporter Mla MlaB component